MSDRAFDPGLASNLVKYAEQLLAKEDYSDALEAAEEAAGVYEELLGSDRTATEPLLAHALRIGAAACTGQERFSEALASAQRAKDLYESALEEADNKPALRDNLLITLELVSSLQIRLEQPQDAMNTADRAIAILQEAQQHRMRGPKKPGRAVFWLLRGEALLALGRVEDAVTAIRTALQRSTASDLPQLRTTGLPVLSRAADRLREHGGAAEIETEISGITAEILRRSTAYALAEDTDSYKAINLYRRIAEDTPDSALPALAGALRDLSSRLLDQGDFEGALRVATQAVGINRRLADKNPDTYVAHLVHSLRDHAFIQWTLGERGGDTERLKDAIAELDSAIELLPTDSGNRTELLIELVGMRLHLASQTGDDQSMDRAVDEAHSATLSASGHDQSRIRALAVLSQALRYRFQRTRSLSDIDEAIGSVREALAIAPMDDPPGGELLSVLANNLRARYTATGNLTDLDEAMEVLREASTAAPSDDPRLGRLLSELGTVLMTRYSQTGDAVDLDRVIATSRQAFETTPESDGATRSAILETLSQALSARYERSSNAVDLQDAVAAAQTSVAVTPAGSPNSLTARYILATSLFQQFTALGDRSALSEAIEAMRHAADAAPPDSANRALALHNLAVMLKAQFDISGDANDINAAVLTAEEAVNLAVPDNPFYERVIQNLCGALESRYRSSGIPTDLDRAIEGWQRLAELTQEHPEIPLTFIRLSNALRIRYNRTHDLDDLNAAIDAAASAITAAPTNHALQVQSIGSKAEGLLARAMVSGSIDDLDESVALARQAIRIAGKDGPDLAHYRNVLDSALEARFTISTDLTDRASWLTSRFEQTGNQRHLDDALTAFRTVTASVQETPLDRIRAAHQLGRLAMSNGRFEEALDGFRIAIELLPRLLSDRMWRESQLLDSGSLTELASDAAACALQAGQPERALHLLEQGRGVLLTQALGSRDELATLRERAPDLANRMDALRTELDETPDVTLDASRRRQLASEFDQLIARIREMPGMARFLSQPTVGNLLAEAAAGPIVVINISDYRCDALVVGVERVSVIRLPGLDRESAVARARRFQAALTPSYQPLSDRLEQETVVAETLGWLWDTVASPVLEALDLHHAPLLGSPWPRLWWIPTGPMTLFPLHAAGRSTNVLDYVVSSYAVTITALARARATEPQHGHSDSALVILPPARPGYVTLPGADRETQAIAEMLPTARVLTGSQATMERTLQALPDAQILHFVGHGLYDSTNPGRSGLLLSDGRLSPVTFASFSESHPQLAFLSACMSDQALSIDTGEAVNLGMILHQAGYRHTISTLWEVNDRTNADIAQDFYSRITTERINVEDSAIALHAVACRFRDRFPHIPSLWAAHIHVGP